MVGLNRHHHLDRFRPFLEELVESQQTVGTGSCWEHQWESCHRPCCTPSLDLWRVTLDESVNSKDRLDRQLVRLIHHERMPFFVEIQFFHVPGGRYGETTRFPT